MEPNELPDELYAPDIPHSAVEYALTDFYVNMLPDDAYFQYQGTAISQGIPSGMPEANQASGSGSQAAGSSLGGQQCQEGRATAPAKRYADVAEGPSSSQTKRHAQSTEWQPGITASRQVAEFATARHLSESRPPSDGALAQRRYAAKQKAKKTNVQKELDELSARLAVLMNEKQELEAKTQNLEKDLKTWQAHVEESFADPETHLLQQLKLIGSIAELMTDVLERPVIVEEVAKWTIHEWITVYWEAFMSRMRTLFQASVATPGGTAEQQLGDLQAMALKLGGFNSCFQTGLLAWNIEETNKGTHLPQAAQLWEATLTALRLTEDQETALLTAYKELLDRISREAVHRHDILGRLGIEAQFVPEEELYRTPTAQELVQSFRLEQTAVLGFVFQVDVVLSNLQMAVLSVMSHPWCPEILEVCAALARQKQAEVTQIPEAGRLALEGSPLMPNYTSYGLLSLRTLGYGLGLRMRQAVLVCPFESIMPRVGFPWPGHDGVSKMTILDVHMGRWRQYSCWEWMGLVSSEQRLVHNPVVSC